MKFKKEDRAEFARSIYAALLVSGNLPADGNPQQVGALLQLHIDRFDAALDQMKQPEQVIVEDSVAAGKRRRRSL
ncbi:hypothetical protein [Hydrocarboniphaga sp.]|uniref:hypothetical protein n=1 Tax=Hydrocarboniphaga sp. TaxID=2033016 RepID=UPI003D0BF146